MESWRHTLTRRRLVEGGRPGCPLARWEDVEFDANFSMARCCDVEAKAVRVLVRIEQHTEGVDPDVAVSDPTNLGLRVSRKVACACDPDTRNHYFLSTSGVITAVQWLLTVAPGTEFFVTAK